MAAPPISEGGMVHVVMNNLGLGAQQAPTCIASCCSPVVNPVAARQLVSCSLLTLARCLRACMRGPSERPPVAARPLHRRAGQATESAWVREVLPELPAQANKGRVGRALMLSCKWWAQRASQRVASLVQTTLPW
jgi:hypothetical protein